MILKILDRMAAIILGSILYSLKTIGFNLLFLGASFIATMMLPFLISIHLSRLTVPPLLRFFLVTASVPFIMLCVAVALSLILTFNTLKDLLKINFVAISRGFTHGISGIPPMIFKEHLLFCSSLKIVNNILNNNEPKHGLTLKQLQDLELRLDKKKKSVLLTNSEIISIINIVKPLLKKDEIVAIINVLKPLQTEDEIAIISNIHESHLTGEKIIAITNILKPLLTSDEISSINNLLHSLQTKNEIRTFSPTTEPSPVLEKIDAKKLKALFKRFKRYVGLKNRLDTLDLANGCLPDGDELVVLTDVKEPILLIKQFSTNEPVKLWRTVPNSTKITNKPDLFEWLKTSSLHPIEKESVLAPNDYEKNKIIYKSRYRWHQYTNVTNSHELQETAAEIRLLLPKKSILMKIEANTVQLEKNYLTTLFGVFRWKASPNSAENKNLEIKLSNDRSLG